MAPKLSIITPVKNAASWLAECMESCLEQSFTDWEWIWVDDHSTDNSAELISAFADMDARIQLHTNPGKGIISALEKGLAEALGTFITRMDADDLMPEGRLAHMIEAIQNAPSKTIVTGLVQYFSDCEVSPGYKQYEDWLNNVNIQNGQWEHIYRECVVASPNWMMRTEELRAIGGFSGLEYPEDYDLVFRLHEHDFTLNCLHETTLMWREHPARTSRNSQNYSQQKFFELKLNRFLKLDFDSSKPLVLWGTGVKARLTADILHQKNIDFTWMDLHPEKYPNGINGKTIFGFKEIENINSLQLLLAVYPPKKPLQLIIEYLEQTGLKPGVDYWFL